MAIIQRLRRFADPPGPPASVGEPGQIAISDPATGLTDFYFASSTGAWKSLLGEWRDQNNGLAGLDNTGKLHASAIPQATLATMGGGQLASAAEAIAGADANKLVTPATLASALAAAGVAVYSATETVEGIAEIATTDEVTDGALDDKIITPLKFKPWADIINANSFNISSLQDAVTALNNADTAFDGRVDTVEADLASLTTRVTTAEGNITNLQGRMTAAEASIVTLQGKTGTATIAAEGIARLADQTEVNTGAAGALIVTPTTLAARIAAIPTPPYASQIEANTGTEAAKAITPLTLRNLQSWFVGPIGIGSAVTAGYLLDLKPSPAAAAYLKIDAGASFTAAFVLNSARQYAVTADNTGVFQIWDNTAGAVRFKVDAAANAMVYGTLTVSKSGGSIVAIQSTSANDAVLYFQASSILRSSWGWAPAGNYSYHNYYDATGAYVWGPLSANATGVGIGGTAGTSIRLHVIAPGYNEMRLEAGSSVQVRYSLKNTDRTWGMLMAGLNVGHFEIWDLTSSQIRMSCDTNGAWRVCTRADGYASLQVLATSQQAILYLQNNSRQWGLVCEGTGVFWLYDYSAARASLVVDTNGHVNVTTGYLYCAAGMRGAEGDAGRLKCYNTNNFVTFSWSGTQLFARIDNGGAVVALN